MTKLTTRQQLVLDFIQRHIADYGSPPTVREMCRELKIASTNGVADHLRALERKGMIAMDGDGKSRSIRVLVPSKDAVLLELHRQFRSGSGGGWPEINARRRTFGSVNTAEVDLAIALLQEEVTSKVVDDSGRRARVDACIASATATVHARLRR